MERESFVFYKDWRDAIKDLPDDIRLELYDSIMEYAFTGKVEGLKPMVNIAFNFIKPKMDRDAEKYMSVSEKNRLNGSKGGRPKKETQQNPNNPIKPTRFSVNPNNLDNDSDNVNDNNSLSNAQAHEEFPPAEVFDKTLGDCCNELLSNQTWINQFSMNIHSIGYGDFNEDSCKKYIKLYFMEMQNRGIAKKSPADAMSHFASWLKIELKKQKDDRARKTTFSPTATNPARKVVCSKVEAAADRKFIGRTQKDYSARF